MNLEIIKIPYMGFERTSIEAKCYFKNDNGILIERFVENPRQVKELQHILSQVEYDYALFEYSLMPVFVRDYTYHCLLKLFDTSGKSVDIIHIKQDQRKYFFTDAENKAIYKAERGY